jgi:hypothetical protein
MTTNNLNDSDAMSAINAKILSSVTGGAGWIPGWQPGWGIGPAKPPAKTSQDSGGWIPGWQRTWGIGPAEPPALATTSL